MDYHNAPHYRNEKLAMDLVSTTPSRYDFGNGSAGMAGPRLSAGSDLDCTFASSKSDVQGGDWEERSSECYDKIVATVDGKRYS